MAFEFLHLRGSTVQPGRRSGSRPSASQTQSKASSPTRCILYAAGPGDVIGTYGYWKAGQDDPHEVARTYSGQFFDVCRELGARGYVITLRPERRRVEEGNLVIEDRPVRGVKSGGMAYHAGQIEYGVRLAVTAWRQKADAAVVSNGTHWFVLTLMRLAGVRVIPTIHCALWPAGRAPRGKVAKLIGKLDGWFWRRIAYATICVSPECERQVRYLAGEPRGEIYQVRAQYRAGYLDALAPPSWPAQGAFCVMYAGRIERNKGVFDLLQIARRLAVQMPGRFTWEICGAGSADVELGRAAAEAGLGNAFILRGKLDRVAMGDAFGRAHAVIVPTTGDFAEGLNKVCVESILAGRPVITSIHSNALDVLGAAAIEVPSGDVGAYGDALVALAEDRPAYEAACAACLSVQGQFYDKGRSWGSTLKSILAGMS
jgi:glycogen(starch) synthase